MAAVEQAFASARAQSATLREALTKPALDRPKYVILRLEDAKALGAAVGDQAELTPIVERLYAETGGDIEEIADLLKNQPFCSACIIEGQKHTCNSLSAQKLGRRLQRLINRANAHSRETTVRG